MRPGLLTGMGALLLATGGAGAAPVAAPLVPPAAGTPRTGADTLPAVVLHPPLAARFLCHDHPAGQLEHPGDALGRDCVVVRYAAGPGDRFPTLFEGDGLRNEDWHAWGAPVLAPFDGEVEAVHVNPEPNRPGERGEGRASLIVFRHSSGIRVMYGHLRDIRVEEGEAVAAGDTVAAVGNDGFSWFPHLHLGAWSEETPLQIRFDLQAMGRASGGSDRPDSRPG